MHFICTGAHFICIYSKDAPWCIYITLILSIDISVVYNSYVGTLQQWLMNLFNRIIWWPIWQHPYLHSNTASQLVKWGAINWLARHMRWQHHRVLQFIDIPIVPYLNSLLTPQKGVTVTPHVLQWEYIELPICLRRNLLMRTLSIEAYQCVTIGQVITWSWSCGYVRITNKIVYYQLTNYTRVGALLWFSQEILCFVRWEVFANEHFYLGNCCRLRDYPQWPIIIIIWTVYPPSGRPWTLSHDVTMSTLWSHAWASHAATVTCFHTDVNVVHTCLKISS